ncbi:hypothetical protein [Providencia rustigianii]|uniref:hypothetical protein n=1 Tax=Providencia rustigianii TaxID=158850 RepID=UPI0001BC3DB9
MASIDTVIIAPKMLSILKTQRDEYNNIGFNIIIDEYSNNGNLNSLISLFDEIFLVVR